MSWQVKIKAGSRRSVTPIPYFYMVFVAYLDASAAQGKVSQARFADGNAESARRQIVRDIRIARKIAANVAVGVFPGTY